MKALNAIMMSGREVLPLIEGGKGVSVSTGISSGAWANAGGIGTFSGVNADSYDENGNRIDYVYQGATRRDRHEELIDLSIKGGIAQAKRAYETAAGKGAIHMNVLWEMGGAERVLHGVLENTKGLVHGITCGAGMPYKLSEIAAKYNVYYYPIVSSGRAFRALWKRAYHKVQDLLGGVVYECPWKAGGHNGLSNSEDPNVAQDPYPRVVELRNTMNTAGLNNTPIIMAGGVWHLEDWEDWLDNPEIGPIAFQFGTRPLLTKESPISDQWKQKLLTLKPGDVYLNRFSPTGFYSSAVENDFLKNLIGRSARQVEYRAKPEEGFEEGLPLGPRGRPIYLSADDHAAASGWLSQGFTEGLKTPDGTIVFETPEHAAIIHKDQVECMGCLSHCKFSNWAQGDSGTTGKKADPRSFCIQKTLQAAAHGSDIDNELMFAGHNAFNFANDPYYANGFIPTVKELVERIAIGK